MTAKKTNATAQNMIETATEVIIDTVPPGWAKKLDSRYYSVKRYNDRNVYVLNNNAYRQAKVISRPRPGEVRLRVDNRVLDVLEATRVILNVL